MSILSRKIYKAIERELYRYPIIQEEVTEARERIIYGNSTMYGNVGGGQSHHSDPTALKGIKLADPELVIKEAWINVIDKVIKKYKGTEIGKLMQLQYFEQRGPAYIQRKLHIERTTCFAWRNEIVISTALIAQKYNLIDVENITLNQSDAL
ncbi:MAG: transcriptional regulator [Clostridiales bacterium]|nr:transcriptional regulator [Clostridiales bacterium]